MPIKSCQLPNGDAGFKFGDEGKCYATREEALKQMKAMIANGYKPGEGEKFAEIDLQIFTTGEFRDGTVKVDEATLETVVGNFNKHKGKIVPLVRFGHGDKQVVLRYMAEQLGFPVEELQDLDGEELYGVGKINELYRNHNGLWAKTYVPDKFVEFVKDTTTRRISPEFYNTKDGWVLRAITLTGIPENKNNPYIEFSESEMLKKEDSKMADEKNRELELYAESKKKDELLVAKDKEIERLAGELKANARTLKLQEIDMKVERLINAGNIAQCDKAIVTEIFKEAAGIEIKRFTENKSNLEVFMETLKKVDVKDYSKVEDGKKKEPVDETGDESLRFNEKLKAETAKLLKDNPNYDYGAAQVAALAILNSMKQ